MTVRVPAPAPSAVVMLARRRVTAVRAIVTSLPALVFVLAGCGRHSEPAPAATALSTGERVYRDYCAVCHMPDGEGVQNFQPALRDNPIVRGDPAKLEAVIRAGSAALQDREPLYAAEMPPFGLLSDEEVRGVIAYVRERFGSAEADQAP